jgi:hypothetical protein
LPLVAVAVERGYPFRDALVSWCRARMSAAVRGVPGPALPERVPVAEVVSEGPVGVVVCWSGWAGSVVVLRLSMMTWCRRRLALRDEYARRQVKSGWMWGGRGKREREAGGASGSGSW